MWATFAKHWFLAAIAVCFFTGYFASEPLDPLREMSGVRSMIVFAVMWMMGVTLRADSIVRSVKQPLPTLLAIAVNIAVVPLLSLPSRIWLPAASFGGLFVATLVPCTLASASVWTRKAGGDDSISLMTTVVTNLACVFVLPVGIVTVLSSTVEVSAGEQMRKLALVVVTPLVLAQAMRRWGVSTWADRNKIRIAVLAQFGILAMVLFGAVASANYLGGESGGATWTTLIVIVLSCIAIHLGALWIGIAASRRTGAGKPEQIAVGIAGSQKTLMVGLQIAIDCGVSVVPMLAYHISQLILDTIVADRWKKQVGETSDARTESSRDTRTN
jgi:sodium/bile acid cotransporter 7